MRTTVLILSMAASAYAQNTGLTARQLYLQPAADSSAQSAPATPAPAPRKRALTPTTPKAPSNTAETTVNPPSEPAAPPPPPAPAPAADVPPAMHLGLRYNVLKVDPESRVSREVDPDMNFKAGDCLAIRFTPNRGGYMYVFNEGSSGAWQTMLPSASMPDESNMLRPGVSTQVPQDYCFKVGDPRGTENLVVVLTEKEEDQRQIDNAIRRSVQGRGQNLASSPAPAPSRVDEVVIAMDRPPAGGRRLTSRDLAIEKVGAPRASNEPPNSVYIVRTAAEKTDRMIIEIKLRHE